MLEPWLAARSGALPAAAELRSYDSAEDGRHNFLLSLGEAARISRAGAAQPALLLAASLRSFVAERPDFLALFRRRSVVERAECFRSCTRWDAERKDSHARADCSRGPRVLRHYSFAQEVRRLVQELLRSQLWEPRDWLPEPVD